MKILVLLFAALLVAGFCEKSSGQKPKPLSDDDIERLLKVAVEFDSLQERKLMLYQVNKSKPYSGWTKEMYDSGQVKSLDQVKDGKPDGLQTMWHENGQKKHEETYKDGKRDGLGLRWHPNGQKQYEATYKDGEPVDGLQTFWHENGQKMVEETFKDGERLSEKLWNSKGEEVETLLEAVK